MHGQWDAREFPRLATSEKWLAERREGSSALETRVKLGARETGNPAWVRLSFEGQFLCRGVGAGVSLGAKIRVAVFVPQGGRRREAHHLLRSVCWTSGVARQSGLI